MSTPIALPAPRVFRLLHVRFKRLPHVRFKRPRWPRGSRVCLVLGLMWRVATVEGVVAGDLLWCIVSPVLAAWNLRDWWRSRDDDDGPSAT
jgi:hypothetical protein